MSVAELAVFVVLNLAACDTTQEFRMAKRSKNLGTVFVSGIWQVL